MAKPLRKLYQECEVARNLRDQIRELSVRQVIQRLRENNLNDRGPSTEQRDRLIRFELRAMAIPGVVPVWNAEVDVAQDYLEEQQRAQVEQIEQRDNERNENREEQQITVEVAVHREVQSTDQDSESSESDEQSRTIVARETDKRIRLPSEPGLRQTPRASIPRNSRLVLNEQVHMMHHHQVNGDTQDFQHFARNIRIENPRSPRTSTVLAQRSISPRTGNYESDRGLYNGRPRTATSVRGTDLDHIEVLPDSSESEASSESSDMEESCLRNRQREGESTRRMSDRLDSKQKRVKYRSELSGSDDQYEERRDDRSRSNRSDKREKSRKQQPTVYIAEVEKSVVEKDRQIRKLERELEKSRRKVEASKAKKLPSE